MRVVTVLVLILFLQACELLNIPKPDEVKQNTSCVVDLTSEELQGMCDVDEWLNFVITHQTMNWSERKALIKTLGKSDVDMLKKILLSQAVDTPYQDRLRAQLWSEDLMPKFEEPLQSFVKLLIYQPNQQVLELESAIVTLNKINLKHAEEIDAMQALIKQHQDQLDQLLKLETNLVEKVREPDR
ncbi:hypothetical protein EYS14_10480 [Alteromonadaceae bacterium M269]|nr:hypothetical protein EYS14_10480 [Alteromonadaceae bacterium M269]